MKAIAADAREEKVAALIEEHRRLDERLRILETQRFLTSAEQVEYARLKKEKLRAKDRIMLLRVMPTASA
ncbi:MAG TPA: YdcH family protein [Kofleriaceae bacterium]|nr:YdcH family protein [Kofleriaceae bacterium]